LRDQLTEAQGKRGKVVSREDFLKETIEAWSRYYCIDETGYQMHFSEIECCEKIAEAIHNLVYGEGDDGNV
jgi:hypothetical protein